MSTERREKSNTNKATSVYVDKEVARLIQIIAALNGIAVKTVVRQGVFGYFGVKGDQDLEAFLKEFDSLLTNFHLRAELPNRETGTPAPDNSTDK